MKKILPLIFAFTFFVCFVNAQDSQTEDNQEFTVTLKADKDEIISGEPVFLTFEVKSPFVVDLSKKIKNPIKMKYLDKILPQVRIFKVDENGVESEFKNDFPYYRNGVIKIFEEGASEKFLLTVDDDFINYKPQESVSQRIMIGIAGQKQTETNYKILIEDTLYIKEYNPKMDYSSVITSSTITQSILLKVHSSNDSELGNIIENLGKKLDVFLDNPDFEEKYNEDKEIRVTSNETIEALLFLNDKRSMPYLVKLYGFSKTFLHPIIKPEKILKVIEKSEPKEIEDYALILVNSPSQFIRLSAVSFLSKSTESNILTLVASKVNDSNMMIRAYAMESLFKLRTEDSINILKNLAKEKDIYISTLAKEYLKQIEKDKLKITQ